MREFICYHPPKGNLWGHTLRQRSVMSAWNAIQSFLAECTLPEPAQLRRLVVYGDSPWNDTGMASAQVAAATSAFGPHTEVGLCRSQSPTGEVNEWQDHIWKADGLELAAVLEFLTTRDPWPTRRHNVVSADIDIGFQWRDPLSRDLLANQDAGFATDDGALRSTLAIKLGHRTRIEPDIRLPFPEGSPSLPPFLRFIQSAFPATLHDKHFRVATPRPKGGGYQVRRLVIPPSIAT